MIYLIIGVGVFVVIGATILIKEIFFERTPMNSIYCNQDYYDE
ncbi:hypothetical protein SAMN04515674_105291 [Pseudarcicella hirudinis]|uniref:Uncharacterized protein n=1 Tax=Pseudarcicella hirudinis TaxID=1079859 RepID=A0A1I5SZA1_9BACT|nr:hypothetical protein SAMN04515674_105291 [Pseudarcicella hirudinis]